MSDDERLPDPRAAATALPAGTAIILRHRNAIKRRSLAGALKTICTARSLLLIVAGDPQLAMEVRADGIHLAEHDLKRSALPCYWARRRNMIITAAAHNQSALNLAENACVHMVLLSPIFPTESHPSRRSLGPLMLTKLSRNSRIPIYALGGVNIDNIRRIRHSGIVGLAGISGITGPS